jgi:hypothetical protein
VNEVTAALAVLDTLLSMVREVAPSEETASTSSQMHSVWQAAKERHDILSRLLM